jgi:tetratricopeptide (TPR) repeat protein
VTSDPGSPRARPNRRRRIALIVVVVLMVAARRRLGQLDPDLLPMSRPGLEAFLRYIAGDYQGAATGYREHLRGVFDTGGASVNDEQLALLAGDRERARALATATLARDPLASGSMLTLAELSLDDGATGDAAVWVDRALQVTPTDLDARLLATVVHSRTGDYGPAVHMMSLALRDWQPAGRATTFIRVLGETGRLYDLRGNRPNCLLAALHRYLRIYDGHQGGLAIARATDAIAIGDRADDAWVTLGVVRQKEGEDEAALAAFLRAIAENPRNADAHRWAAVVYADRGDLENEYRLARAAHDIEPDDPAYAIPLAEILAERLGDYRTALGIMTKVLASGAPTPALLDRLGYLHGLVGDVDEAIRFLQQAVAADPRQPAHLRNLAWVLGVQGREDEAIATLRRALTIDPRKTETREQLAIAYRESGRYDEAIPELERVYREDPARRAYLPELCISLHLAARFDAARECARQYLMMSPASPDMLFLRSFSLASALDGVGGG